MVCLRLLCFLGGAVFFLEVFFIKRILILALCLCLASCLLAVPALAANLDYTDYISDMYVDGDNDVVKVDLPFDNAYSVVVEYDTVNPAGSPIASGSGGSISWNATADMFYYIDTYPLGPALAGGDKLDLTNIPNGSVLTVSFSCDLMAASGYGTPHHDVWIYYCDASNNVVGSTQNTAGTFPPGDKSAVVSFTLDKPSGAVSLYFCVQVDDLQPNYSGKYTFTLESVDLELSISALYLQQIQSGKTNELLEKVNEQLQEQGQTLDDVLSQQQQTNDKLDDIIGYDPDLSTPEGGEVLDDLEDLEDGLLNDSEDGLNSALDVQQSTLDILVEYFSAFGALAIIFNLFSTLPFFQALLYASLSLGVFSLVFGLSLSVVKSVSERSGGSKSH